MKINLITLGCLILLVSLVYAGEGVIDIAYSPYTVSQSGSYLVVKDLTTPANLNCITINTSNVTIDLNGHTLYGAGTTVGSSGIGIFANVNQRNILVMNGTIRDFRETGISISGMNHQVTRIRVFGNGYDGIAVGSNCNVYDNTMYGNVHDGIYAFYGCTITGNSSYSNGNYGINAGNDCTVIGNTVAENSGGGIFSAYDSKITGNTITGNIGNGIDVWERCLLTDNNVHNNTSVGISATGMMDDACCTIIGNNVSNSIFGIDAGSSCTITGNNVVNNWQFGISVEWNCQVVGNTLSQQTGALGTATGVDVSGLRNRIDSNHIVNNTIGISFLNSTNWYGRNTFSGNSSDTTGSVPSAPPAAYANQFF